MIISSSVHLEQIPGELFLVSCLQKSINFTVNNKSIKRGKLLLFRRFHYFVQLALMSEKGTRENVDVPIPFKVEHYPEEGLLYFDYRIKSLEVETLPLMPDKITSAYFDKILEIQVINNCKLICL